MYIFFLIQLINKGMSMTSMVILFCAITSFHAVRVVGQKSQYETHSSGKGGLSWPKDVFTSRDCNGERQPVVEFWRLNGIQWMFFSQRVTWEEGRMLCLNYNARLAVIDDMEKAVSVAKSMADSNIEMLDSWIGGRRIDFVWTWIDDASTHGIKTEIPMDPNVEDFPPWTREPTRPTKECLAIDRRSHDYPNFIDLDCRLQRPIICEKKSEDMVGVPVPSKWIQIGRNTYTLYHGKVTWHEAATFCRAQGSRLAILKTTTVINILTNSMTKTRPDFENVWIGAYFSYGQWIWMATGSILNPLTDERGYPPWRFGRPEKNDGCLLLDRHLEDSTSFIETTCDRKRDFVCEEYPEDEDEDWLNEPAKFFHGNSTYIIYPLDKTWSESRSFCNERGSVLAHVGSIDTLNLIIEAMGDHPKDIHHVWLGGQFRLKTHSWYWIDSDDEIPKVKDEFGFPPWAQIDTGLDHDPASSSCLNVDRTDHVKPHFYALDCASKQPFACKITCDVAPLVKNGTWKCYDIADGRECSLQCDSGLMVMGVRNVTCTVFGGWVTGLHWLEFPLCLEPEDYTSRMIRSVSHDIRKSAGYYIIIDHMEPVMRSLSLTLAERLVKAFPISRNLQMGMTCFATNPPTHVPFNQTDSCEVLEAINSAKKMVTSSEKKVERKSNENTFYTDVSMFNGRRILIIAIVDSKRASAYAEFIDQVKSSGHHVSVIGLEEDWKMLLPLATVGFDRRSNIFLFDEVELGNIINKLKKMEHKPSKCKNSTPRANFMKTIVPIMEIAVTSTTAETTNETTAETTGINIVTTEETATNNPDELINRRGFPSGIVNPAVQTEKEIPGLTDRRTMNFDEQVKDSSVLSNITKSDESMPKIYSEQETKRDVPSAGHESENGQSPIQPKVTKDSSSEGVPLEHPPDETASPSDGNE